MRISLANQVKKQSKLVYFVAYNFEISPRNQCNPWVNIIEFSVPSYEYIMQAKFIFFKHFCSRKALHKIPEGLREQKCALQPYSKI